MQSISVCVKSCRECSVKEKQNANVWSNGNKPNLPSDITCFIKQSSALCCKPILFFSRSILNVRHPLGHAIFCRRWYYSRRARGNHNQPATAQHVTNLSFLLGKGSINLAGERKLTDLLEETLEKKLLWIKHRYWCKSTSWEDVSGTVWSQRSPSLPFQRARTDGEC